MFTFRVDDMTCGHCAGSITRAIQAADDQARVTVDLGRHLVRVASSSADGRTLAEAIAEAGYTPVPVTDTPAAPAPQAAGSCCGCRG